MRLLFSRCFALATAFVACVTAPALHAADGLTPEIQARIDAKVVEIKTWAAAPVLVQAVVALNAPPAAERAAMTQDKWKGLSLLDPFVRGLTRNDAATVLKTHKAEWVTEAFLSAADGTKAAFLSKPTNWSHAGKAKHDDPMQGRVWQGGVEVDQSTGLQQIQVGVPVLHDGKPVGSLVVGILLGKL